MSLLLACAWAVAAAQTATGDPCAEAHPLERVQRTLGSTQGAIPTSEEMVDLPDNLPRQQVGSTLFARYRFELERCTQERVLFVPRAGASYQIAVDGVPARRLAPHAHEAGWESAAHMNPRIPMLFRVPAGARRIDVELEGLPFMAFGLPALKVGPAMALAPLQARTYTRVIDWTLNAGYLIATLAAVGVWIWTRRRHDLGLAWYLASSVVWVVRGLYSTINELWLPPTVFELGVALQVALMAPPTVAATLHLLRQWSRAWAWRLGISTAACVALLAATLAMPLQAHGFRALVYAVTVGWMVTALVLAVRHRSTLAGWRGTVVLAGYVALLVGIVSDYLYVLGLRALGETSISLLVWGYLALLLCLLVVLVDHAMRAVDRIQQINTELDQKVQERTQEIAALYSLRQAQELALADAQARQQERERLVREIHDGIGGQLTTTLRGVERGRFTPQALEQALQDCLDDLRLVMDASSMHDRLDAALAAWRHRWDARLELLGLELRWRVQDPLDTPGLDAQGVLHLLRILQEAVTNALKHAHASVLEVRVCSDAQALELHIEDNGQGWKDERPPNTAGRGLASMRQRAAQLGAQLELRSTAGEGTCVQLRKPWPKAT